MNPLVSIIIPTYNRAHLLGETLNSVLNQTYLNWECIVVDDGSTDHTPELINFYCERDSRIHFHSRPINRARGGNAIRNMGYEYSSGDFLIFLDSDDILDANCLLNRLKVAKQLPDFSFYVFKMQSFHHQIGDSNKIINKYASKESEYFEMLLKHDIPWQLTALFIRRSSFNYFDEDIKRFQDVLFSLKLIFFNKKFKVLDLSPDCYYRNDILNKLKYKDPHFQKMIFRSFLKFLQVCEKDIFIHLNKPSLHYKYKQLLVTAYKRLLISYAFLNKKEIKKINYKIYNLLIEKNYLNSSDKLKLYVVNLILINEKFIPRGIGLFRLSQRLVND